MGQHSRKPSPHDRKLSPAKRWTAVAAGAAVVCAASTTAWAAFGNDDSYRRTMGTAPGQATTPDEAARRHNSRPSPASTTPAAHPETTTSPDSGGDTGSQGSGPVTATPSPGAKTDSRERRAKAEAGGSGAKIESEETAKPGTPKPKTHSSKPAFRVLSSGKCGASYYGDPQMTASGERFDPSAMTAAHKTLPLGSKVRVINPANREAVTVRINDRGPYIGGRCLDLSRAAFAAIGNISAGVMKVRYQVLAR
ncbi:septal ring lytic transglycosylase RlpA family protein [Nonomuraea diastatica]|uniref:Probable endolytic peptidoglycan transglycosylase RlpA n=1 Tax=Nonomuraea diastatica TaxID=1848329 RepID=A0A4R4W524_9ACTN|nr:septal ring lytic transglycosylase RlpA family protein [Nonomuraea diastatica]